jgi:hypothetical protein
MFHAVSVLVKAGFVHRVAPLVLHRGAGGHFRSVVVDGGSVAAELRRRRLGRRGLADRVAASSGTTWLPDDLRAVSSDLLLLAALSLSRRFYVVEPADDGYHD